MNDKYTNFPKLNVSELKATLATIGTATITTATITNLTVTNFALNSKVAAIADITDSATGAQIATAVNSIIAGLVTAGILTESE